MINIDYKLPRALFDPIHHLSFGLVSQDPLR